MNVHYIQAPCQTRSHNAHKPYHGQGNLFVFRSAPEYFYIFVCDDSPTLADR